MLIVLIVHRSLKKTGPKSTVYVTKQSITKNMIHYTWISEDERSKNGLGPMTPKTSLITKHLYVFTSFSKVLLILRGHTNIVAGCSITHDERKFATASWDKSILIWDVATGMYRWCWFLDIELWECDDLFCEILHICYRVG